MNECKFKHTERGGLYIMIFIILWLTCMKSCNLDPEVTNYKLSKKLDVIEKAISE
ncbi:MAG: hypothetical protein ACUZ8I_07360 [Candidatus Scalindua sp.]